jgi:regulator of protease activity HflC (stomatin/prohibitin superfamily)
VALPFAFTGATRDFQNATLQGQLTYRVTDPARLAQLLDFSIRPSGTYRTDDPLKLRERLTQAAQIHLRAVVQQLDLRDVLIGSTRIAGEVLTRMRASDAVTILGIEILDISLLDAKPSPETARALEAEAREALLRRADEAIYARRQAAVEEERKIKETELNTQIAVEQKNRQIRETKMAADISVEEQRAALIAKRADNEKIDADSKAYALDATLRAVRGIDWKTLTALSTNGSDPRLTIALAFRELAENAEKIGELNITPDLLKGLLGSAGTKSA